MKEDHHKYLGSVIILPFHSPLSSLRVDIGHPQMNLIIHALWVGNATGILCYDNPGQGWGGMSAMPPYQPS